MSQIIISFLLLPFTMSLYGSDTVGCVYVAKYKDDKECAVSYTFDDGLKEHYTLAAPELEKYGFRGTFWIYSTRINDAEANPEKSTHMNWSNLKDMSLNGHEISNHSWSHKDLTKIPYTEAKIEIEKNDSAIFSNIGLMPKTFCYPYNAFNDSILALASKNRVGTRTNHFGVGGRKNKSTTEKLNQKIDELLKNQEWGVAMIHGITYGYDAFSNAKVLWDHFEYVKKMEDRIWVDTFEKISSYQQKRDSIELYIEKYRNTYTIIPKLVLDRTLFTGLLTMVVEIGDAKKISIYQDSKNLSFKKLCDRALFDFDPFGRRVEIILE